MNGAREHIEKIWELPYHLTLEFGGFDGAPEKKDLKPVLYYEGQGTCLARPKVIERTSKHVTILLDDKLQKLGLGRFELCVHQACCEECDCIKLEFCGECAVTKVSGKPVEKECDIRR